MRIIKPHSKPKHSEPGTVWYKKISVKTALLAWGLIILTLMMFIIGTLPAQKEILEERMRSEANDIAGSIAQVSSTAITNNDYGFIVDHCLKVIEKSKSIVYVVIVRNDGFALVHKANYWSQETLKEKTYLPEEKEAVSNLINSSLAGQEVFHYSYPFSYSGIEWGRINVGLSLKKYNQDSRHLYLRTILLALISAIVGFIVSVIFARRLTKPILELHHVSQLVGRGDLNARVKNNSDNELGRLAVSFNEMTESLKNSQENLELKVEERTAELNALNASKDKFFSIIAHDLRGPFNSLLGFSSHLASEIENMPMEDAKMIAESMASSLKNVFGLLENLLQWSRINTGRMECNPEEIQMDEMFDKLLVLFRSGAQNKEISLIKDAEEGLKVTADVNMLETVLRNLISNAIKFTYPGGRIILTARKSASMVEIVISDNGVGISAERLEKLFRIDGNVSTKGTHHEVGSGLGLILCKEFVEMNKGSISVTSRENEGSVFTILLPEASSLVPCEPGGAAGANSSGY